MKIVSLLPSATEMVCILGLQDQLVGVTHECDFPNGINRLPHVTQTLIPHDASSREIDQMVREQLRNTQALYSLDLPVLQELAPDVIVTQALCDVCAVAEDEVRNAACSLASGPQVINLEPQTLDQVLQAIYTVAAAVGVEARAETVISHLASRIETVRSRSEQITSRPRVVLLEWLDPPFSSGHWSPELVRLAGGIEGLGKEGEASRTLRWEEVVAWRPEVVFIACCGFDIARTKQDLPLLNNIPGWRDLPAVINDRVYLTDGAQYFSRPGPRLVDSLEILAHALHPDVHPLPKCLPAALPISG